MLRLVKSRSSGWFAYQTTFLNGAWDRPNINPFFIYGNGTLYNTCSAYTVHMRPICQHHAPAPTSRALLVPYLYHIHLWRVDRAEQTTRIYAQKYIKIRQNGRAYYFKGIKLCRLIAKINARF